MKVEQLRWQEGAGWKTIREGDPARKPQLVIFFAAPSLAESGECYHELRKIYPDAHIIGASTGGEVLGRQLLEGTAVAAAISFKHTAVELASLSLKGVTDYPAAGAELAKALPRENLKAAFLLCDGMIDGPGFVRGILNVLGERFPLMGGLAGDNERFLQTWVSGNEAFQNGHAAIVGLYGDKLTVGSGCMDGHIRFGPMRTITRIEGRVIYEIDGQPALDLYKKYLAEESENFESTLVFNVYPLLITPAGQGPEKKVVRAIFSINEEEKSLLITEAFEPGSQVQLMRGTISNIMEGAETAAKAAKEALLCPIEGDQLAIIISCLGRKLTLGLWTPDELDIVADVLGSEVIQFGFYAYGEIAPDINTHFCLSHNQTMTLTTLAETK